jgi:hypothetical protein
MDSLIVVQNETFFSFDKKGGRLGQSIRNGVDRDVTHTHICSLQGKKAQMKISWSLHLPAETESEGQLFWEAR